MNDRNVSCVDQLSDIQLEEYINGDLPLENSEMVVEHLTVCPECYRRYRGLTTPGREALQPLLDEMSDSRYELREKLGEGGQGRVYLATDRTNQTTVVIKHFCTADTLAFSDHERTWRNEFKNSKRVLHFQQRGNSTAGIAQVYELFEVDEHAVLIREYIDGVTLESQISDQPQERSAEELEQIANWFIEIAEIVNDAHRAGILHGDLKPANIMMRESGSPVLIDFGISLDRREFDSRLGVRAGTLNYMAPEVVLRQAAALSPRCEVWSLGVMLYQLINGGLPFDISQQSNTTAVVEVMESGILFPAVNTGDASQELQAIINKCLAPIPEDRYANASEFAGALRGWRLQQELNRFTASPPQSKVRRVTVVVGFVVMLLAIVQVLFAYTAGSLAWTIDFSWILWGRASFGLFWDCVRQVFLVAALGYLIEIPFRAAFDRVFLFHRRDNSNSKSPDHARIDDAKILWGARSLWLLATVLSLFIIIDYHLHAGPQALATFAQEPPEKTLGFLTKAELTTLASEVPQGERFHFHEKAYLFYLPVSLLNFVGIGTISLAVGYYASCTDTLAIFGIKEIIDRNIGQTPLSVESTFKQFRRMCRDRSQKYLLLGAIFPGWFAVESWISSVAVTAAGWSFVFLLTMLTGVVIWIFFVTWYYSEIFDVCRKSLEAEGLDTAQWSRENSPASFLGDCLLGTLAGRCALLSFAVCIFGFFPFYGR
ncbi:serine/threonine protein kinase [Pirellulaceae bacterium]|nr:serine/threonine protein kinase [Pirellulaceae bacterium]